MRRDQALKYAVAAGFFFGVALAVSILGSTRFDAAMAFALVVGGFLSAALAVIANGEEWP